MASAQPGLGSDERRMLVKLGLAKDVCVLDDDQADADFVDGCFKVAAAICMISKGDYGLFSHVAIATGLLEESLEAYSWLIRRR